MLKAQKKDPVKDLVDSLFKKFSIPLDRPERVELLAFFEQAGRLGVSSLLEKALVEKVKELANKLKREEVEEGRRLVARAKAEHVGALRLVGGGLKINNSRTLMTLPFFSPDQKLRTDCWEYVSQDGKAKLEVHPSPKYGAAKVWDADLLMYALSKGRKAWLESSDKVEDRQFPRTVRFSLYEYLKECGKSVSGRNRQEAKDRLRRLSTTSYACSLMEPKNGTVRQEKYFHLCSAEWVADEEGRPNGIAITFSEEFLSYFASRSDLISLRDDLLVEAWKEDRSGLRKRLLMLVGTHLGEQGSWKVGLVGLQGMCGHQGKLKHFKEAFVALIPGLPWLVAINANKQGEQVVTFSARE